MAASISSDDRIAHLLRRAGFGASREELAFYQDLGLGATIDLLTHYVDVPDDVDDWIRRPGFVNVTASGEFSPNTTINHARQRWLFRMVHTQRPLQEKMALFWHNHFATAYTKVAGAYGAQEGTRMMAGKPADDPYKVKGQIELLREYAVGNFRDLSIAIAKDLAMLVWLDGRTNVRNRPQENYARELMELFTMGVGYYTEQDVYAGARVFTGWNLRRVGARPNNVSYYEFFYNANQHDTGPKEFSFPIYPDGGRTILILTSDHGELQGDFGLLFKGPYHVDALMRVPLIWRPAPSATVTPARIDEPVGLLDLAPTFCSIAGVPVPEWIEGDVLPVASGSGRERVITEWDSQMRFCGMHLRSIYRDGFVCTVFEPTSNEGLFGPADSEIPADITYEGTEGELYDLTHDPLQWRNLWDDPGYKDRREELVADLYDNLPPGREPRLVPEAPT